MVDLIEFNDENSHLWNDFVFNHDNSSYSHLYEWKRIFEDSYSLETKYVGFKFDNNLAAVLPIAMVRPILKKSIGCSLPFLGYAGLLTLEKYHTVRLNDILFNVSKVLGVKVLETRAVDRSLTESETCEYTLMLSLPNNASLIWDRLDAKVRNQIRKAQKSGLTAKWGIEQFDHFYKVYAKNMHDLGTPVHSKKFFSKIIFYLKDYVDILCIRKDDTVIASMFLIKFRQCLSDPWASSYREYLNYNPNMLMYWEALKYGAENGFTEFDFGRSRLNSGTFKFKAQWGAKPVPLVYDLHSFDERNKQSIVSSHGVARPAAALSKRVNSHYRGKKAEMFSAVWRRLPYKITLWLGPKLRKYIP